jgi:hypothetical protein
MAMGFWSIGVVMLPRNRLGAWLHRRRPWRATIVVNGVIMTVFLWPMTAYLLAVLALRPLGLSHQHVGNARWWLERPIWIAVPAMILVVLIRNFGPFERSRPTRRSEPIVVPPSG